MDTNVHLIQTYIHTCTYTNDAIKHSVGQYSTININNANEKLGTERPKPNGKKSIAAHDNISVGKQENQLKKT